MAVSLAEDEVRGVEDILISCCYGVVPSRRD
jgi:hypothetical protein